MFESLTTNQAPNNNMKRIAHKPRVVKRRSGQKPSRNARSTIAGDHREPATRTPKGRYSIRTDSLNRRYAIDKATGRRVSVYKAEKERVERKKPVKAIPRHIPAIKQKKPKSRILAAKRGWETRRAKAQARSDAAKRGWQKRKGVLPFVPPIKVPPAVTMVPLYGTISERWPLYPKVERAARLSFIDLQHEILENIPTHPTPKFDRYHGEGEGARIRREEFGQAMDIGDIDAIIQRLLESGEYNARELYTLYFSPEVA